MPGQIPTARQRIEDTGPLTKKRMETVDDETLAEAKRFITKAVEAHEPFFVWWNGTRMHFRTHVREEHTGISGSERRRVSRRHGRARHECRRAPGSARPARHRRQHGGDVLDRQRPALQHLAGRGLHAVPQREELEHVEPVSAAGEHQREHAGADHELLGDLDERRGLLLIDRGEVDRVIGQQRAPRPLVGPPGARVGRIADELLAAPKHSTRCPLKPAAVKSSPGSANHLVVILSNGVMVENGSRAFGNCPILIGLGPARACPRRAGSAA